MIGRDYDNKYVKMMFSPLISYTKYNSLVRNISLPLLPVQLSRLVRARQWKGYHKIMTDKKHSVSRTSKRACKLLDGEINEHGFLSVVGGCKLLT